MVLHKVAVSFVCLILAVNVVVGIFVSNLNGSCIRCLCHVAGCDLSHTCSGGYCGPFYISKVYWVDAGKPTLPDDSPDRDEAFEDCARDFYCSVKIIESYMARFGKDCNGDGVTDCFDYMMINHNGGRACSSPLFLSELGLRRLKLFRQCRFQ
ncbi:lysozyme 1-like [Leptidea sinapis]|uniref:lysozyme 1-like n=1 Tax=Leptidea sinapis TaxID=189913 RepID=UPI00212BC4FD|nr:lysozyme 1-like [Leptidea sinapis]